MIDWLIESIFVCNDIGIPMTTMLIGVRLVLLESPWQRCVFKRKFTMFKTWGMKDSGFPSFNLIENLRIWTNIRELVAKSY